MNNQTKSTTESSKPRPSDKSQHQKEEKKISQANPESKNPPPEESGE